MSNLSLWDRGPFKIDGATYTPVAFRVLLYLGWLTPDEGRGTLQPRWRRVPWYRKPARTSPFRIIGTIDRYHWYRPRPSLMVLYWRVPYNYREPEFGFAEWGKRFPLRYRGPFEFGGLVTAYKEICVLRQAYYSCVDCVETSSERGPGDQLTGWFCAVTPWIYYSRNISNEPVCR